MMIKINSKADKIVMWILIGLGLYNVFWFFVGFGMGIANAFIK